MKRLYVIVLIVLACWPFVVADAQVLHYTCLTLDTGAGTAHNPAVYDRRYTSMNAWRAGVSPVGGGAQPNFIGANGISGGTVEVLHIIGSWPTVDTTQVAIPASWYTSTTSYVIITAPAVADIRGGVTDYSARTYGYRSPNQYRLNVQNAAAMSLLEANVRVSGWEVSSVTPAANTRQCIYLSGVPTRTGQNTYTEIDGMFLYGHGDQTRSGNNLIHIDDADIWNVMVSNCILSGEFICPTSFGFYIGTMNANGGATAYNNTFEGFVRGVYLSAGKLWAQNNIFRECQYAISGTTQGTPSGGYNVYDIGSLTETANSTRGYRTDKKAAVTYMKADGTGATNFHLSAADTAAIDYGTAILSGVSVTGCTAYQVSILRTDIDLETRADSGSVDVGADEYTSGAPATTPKRRRSVTISISNAWQWLKDLFAPKAWAWR